MKQIKMPSKVPYMNNLNLDDFSWLLNLLALYGGSIVSSNSLPPEWIEQARTSKRMYVDENSLGYIWEPEFKGGFPTTVDEVRLFEWCYPLDMEMPEELNNPDLILKLLRTKIK